MAVLSFPAAADLHTREDGGYAQANAGRGSEVPLPGERLSSLCVPWAGSEALHPQASHCDCA